MLGSWLVLVPIMIIPFQLAVAFFLFFAIPYKTNIFYCEQYWVLFSRDRDALESCHVIWFRVCCFPFKVQCQWWIAICTHKQVHKNYKCRYTIYLTWTGTSLFATERDEKHTTCKVSSMRLLITPQDQCRRRRPKMYYMYVSKYIT